MQASLSVYSFCSAVVVVYGDDDDDVMDELTCLMRTANQSGDLNSERTWSQVDFRR